MSRPIQEAHVFGRVWKKRLNFRFLQALHLRRREVLGSAEVPQGGAERIIFRAEASHGHESCARCIDENGETIEADLTGEGADDTLETAGGFVVGDAGWGAVVDAAAA